MDLSRRDVFGGHNQGVAAINKRHYGTHRFLVRSPYCCFNAVGGDKCWMYDVGRLDARIGANRKALLGEPGNERARLESVRGTKSTDLIWKGASRGPKTNAKH
jgi:hypothetical protein